MDRVLAGVGPTLRIINYDTNADPADAGGGNGTAVVVDSAGVAVTGSPYTATRTALGTYQVALSSSITAFDRYRITWTLPDSTTRTTYFQMVGSFLFALAELQALDAVLLDEAGAFPVTTLIEARENAEQRFEEVCNVSFTRRGTRLALDGSGLTDTNGNGRLVTGLQELRSVTAVTLDGVSIGAELSSLKVYTHGTVVRPGASWPKGVQNISLLAEHGYEAVPEPVRRAGLLYARSTLLRSALEQSDRATAVFTELGGYRLTLAGRDGPTGLPEVDAVLGQFGRRMAGSLA